ncbi:Chaperone of endosialidase [Pricia antarctica]|uniref:Chaperone of endosialidase n=1 Tax=Pricia antarctica TaxID=641691 RepID=A0A1G7BCF4_9FLAO|nr:tail fiber domain-containing protein [Pricia antarctica]SDE24026.1 Chaperone of endosialidase [Pricia antarctica]
MKKVTLNIALLWGFFAASFGQSIGGTRDNGLSNDIQHIGIFNDSLKLSKGGGGIPLSYLRFSLPVMEEIDFPDNMAFGIANTTTANGLAIAGRQGAGSSLVAVRSAAIFGTSEQGSGVVGFSSGSGNVAGVLGSTDNPSGAGIIGRAEGTGFRGFFESSGRAALVTGHGNVGIGIEIPEAKLEVNGDMRVNTDVGKLMLGYPQNGDQWAMTTTGKGANLLFGAKVDGASEFEGRMILVQNGQVGIGTNRPAAQLEITNNSTNVLPQLLLTENERDYARISFGNNDVKNVHWNINGLAANNQKNSKLNFRFKNSNVEADHVTLLGNGKVGIGNTDPDKELVVGNNIGSSWKLPAITVGNENGGAVEAGNAAHSIRLEAENTLGRARIVSHAQYMPDGLSELAIQTKGFIVGQSPGEAERYMMKIVHGSFGLDIQNASSDEDWELYVNTGNGLYLFFNGSVRGEFNAVDGNYYALSDRRFKSDINPIKGILGNMMQLVPSSYKVKEGNPDQKTSLGFIAQDMEKLFPELVSVSTDERSPGIYSLNYAGFEVLAIKAVQEQQVLIEAQKARLNRQIIEIEDIGTRLERLEALVKN